MASKVTIKPGFLVSLKTVVEGGVHYDRRDLDAPEGKPETPDNGTKVERWETVKTVLDAAERERAEKTRSKARAMIARLCYDTAFGPICPLENEKALDAAIATARQLAAEHNVGANFTRVFVRAVKGQIATTDEEAARAIGEEVAELLNGMARAIDQLDPAAIRETATKAQEFEALLSDEQAEKVGEAVKQARKAARAIVKRIEKDGEAAAIVLADIQRGAIEKARIAFLDVDDFGPAIDGDSAPAINVQRAAEIEVG